MDIGIAPDGTTPTSLVARDTVKVTLPGEAGGPMRVIAAQTLDGTGDERRGLTGAHFTGNVQFSERGGGVDRAARSQVMDVAMAPGFGTIEDATFTRGVRFADGPMFATAAAARYAVARGILELSGSEPGSLAPHVLNDQIAVDAARVDITLDGPLLTATGTVKSVIQPRKANAPVSKTDPKLPAMLKEDQPVNVTADRLAYDGKASRAVYTGNALLWQGETSIKGTSLTIDSSSGDLSAAGPVTTSTMLLQDDKKGGKEKVSSIGTSKEFAYLDSLRRATVHRRRPYHRPTRGSHIATRRAVSHIVRRRARTGRGVRRRHAAWRCAQDHGTAIDVLRCRSAVSRDRIASHDPRRMRSRDDRTHVDLLQGHR
ncbi:MAG: LptA/OstA family protein [Vicinamibacterales bacterium]